MNTNMMFVLIFITGLLCLYLGMVIDYSINKDKELGYWEYIGKWNCRLSSDINLPLQNDLVVFTNSRMEIEFPCNDLAVSNVLQGLSIKELGRNGK